MSESDADSSAGQRRAAIVINATKIDDELENLLRDRFASDGWADPLWLETTPDDPGRAMTARAVAEQVDLVVAAGGDGTVRVVLAGLVGSGIPVALLPAGTVNLLARNLGLPMELESAIEVALDDHQREIDMIKLTVGEGDPDHFAVMAGMGLDAMIMDQADADLKKAVGPAAYAVAAAKSLGRKPMRATIMIDDGKPFRRRPSLCVIGNVGEVPGLVSLIPDARLDDGVLDVFVASPRRLRDWLAAIVKVLRRRHHEAAVIDHWTARRVTVTVARSESYQLDGDTEGEAATLTAEVVPGAVTVKVPAAN